jgi:hypothetical protein
MITIRLTRDQARFIDEVFMSYMIMHAKSDLNSNAGNDAKYLNCKIVVSLLKDVELAIKKKLLNTSNKVSLKLTDAHASAFYVYLMKRPVDHINVWAVNFRQQLCDELHPQLFNDRPPVHESVPITLADYAL